MNVENVKSYQLRPSILVLVAVVDVKGHVPHCLNNTTVDGYTEKRKHYNLLYHITYKKTVRIFTGALATVHKLVSEPCRQHLKAILHTIQYNTYFVSLTKDIQPHKAEYFTDGNSGSVLSSSIREWMPA